MVGWALLAAVAGLLYLVDSNAPSTASIHKALPGYLDETWAVVYVVGGILTAWGCAKGLGYLERPGLVLLIGALGLNLAAIVHIRGFAGGMIQSPPYAVAFWIFGGRLRYLQVEDKMRRSGTKLWAMEDKHERREKPDSPPSGRRERRQ